MKVNLTGVEHEEHTYPAGAVCGGKLLICERKQFVCITSIENLNPYYINQYEFNRISFKDIYISKLTYASNPVELFEIQSPLLEQQDIGNI